ncbi:nucleotide exchange factor GrpE [Haliangium sp.]|uniref:nucleotide exchange factor GrpE n=1 Tax=Haliangium sp. TaxID=2663208 RepID=UPI003D0F6A1F
MSKHRDPTVPDAPEQTTENQISDATLPDGPSLEFDAVAAAAELDAFLADQTTNVDDGGASSDYVAGLEADVEALNELVAQKDALIAKRDARITALEDDTERAKERLERQADVELEQRTHKLLGGFLEVLDDLERALSAAREVDHNPAVVDGVELVHKRFLAKLGEFGVSHDPAMGERFDPERHDAMAAVPVTDAAQDGVVVGVMREGYVIGDKVLRPAGVAVGKAS